MQREGKKTLSTEKRHRVIIQAKSAVSDGEGGFTDAFQTSKTVWGSVNPIQARQQAEYRSINVDATHLIRINGAHIVNEADRLLYGTRIFEVLTVEDIQERGIVKVITCKERR